MRANWRREHWAARAVLWILGYVVLVSLPLLALLVGDVPGGRGFWWDLSMAVGFAGLAVMGLQFALTARFRRATAPFGIDIIYYFHRWMAVGGVGLLAMHWLILRGTAPAALAPALPGSAPWHMTAGRVAIVLFVLIVVTSLWRKPLRMEYDRWRYLHAALAVTAVVLAVWHVAGVRQYTSSAWQQGIWGGYTMSWIGLIVYVRLLRPWRQLKKPYRVRSVRPRRGRTWTVTLEPDGHPGLQYQPGQFAWVALRHSPFAAKEHPFSISGSAASEGPLEFTIRELGDFTSTIGDIEPGEIAYVSGPHGAFSIDRYPEAPGFVFVAGGVGIAPIMSMLRTLADRNDPRPLLLVYGNDRAEEILFAEELKDLARRLDLRIEHVLTEPDEHWQGARGYVTEEVLRRVLPEAPAGHEYFLCGPGPMSENVQRALRKLQVPMRRIHSELFEMV